MLINKIVIKTVIDVQHIADRIGERERVKIFGYKTD